MAEIRLIPPGVTGVTGIIQLCDRLAGRVTGATIEVLVEPVQRPSGRGMREARLFFVVMAFGTGVFLMTVVTDCVNFLVRLGRSGLGLKVMAITAVFLFVTIHTAQSEKVDMLLVMKRYHRPLLIRSRVNLLVRDRYHRVRYTNNIGRVHGRVWQALRPEWEGDR